MSVLDADLSLTISAFCLVFFFWSFYLRRHYGRQAMVSAKPVWSLAVLVGISLMSLRGQDYLWILAATALFFGIGSHLLQSNGWRRWLTVGSGTFLAVVAYMIPLPAFLGMSAVMLHFADQMQFVRLHDVDRRCLAERRNMNTESVQDETHRWPMAG